MPWLADGAILFCLRDLTDRRRYELAHDEEALVRSLVQNSAAITMPCRPGTVDSVSGALTRMLGHDPELVEHEPLADIVAPARPAPDRGLALARRGATATQPVIPWPAPAPPSAAGRWFLSNSPSSTSSMIPRSVASLSRPTTSRPASLADHELRNALSLLKATLDATADGILVVDTGADHQLQRRFVEMWQLPDDLLAVGNDSEAIDYVLDQLVQPEDFFKNRGARSHARRREHRHLRSRTAGSSSATRHPNGSRERSSAGSGASATSPTVSVWKTSSPTRPFTMP